MGDPQLPHPEHERAAFEAQTLGRVTLAGDLPAALLEHLEDVPPLDVRQEAAGRARDVAARSGNIGSIASAVPFERMRARSMTFSSSRMLPGQG